MPLADGLELIAAGLPSRRRLGYLFFGQTWAAEAAVVVVISAVTPRILKYGDRGYRFLLLEAGHVGQNLALATSALELGALHLGGFLDDELSQLLRLDPVVEVPLYCMAVGIQDPGRAGKVP